MKRKPSYQELEKRIMELEIEAEERKQNNLESAFLTNLSYKIRSPMNIIIGSADLMLDEKLSKRHREYLHTVKRQGDILLSIIDDILDLSKIVAGQVEIEQIPCSLKSLFNDIDFINQMHIFEKGKNIDLIQNFPDNISRFIISDPFRIQQLMNHLMSNAIKFTEKGYIEYGVLLKDEHTLQFYVMDTGIGIPKEKQEEIFEPFQQTDENHTMKYGGIGLGLSIVKRIVKLMGGEITVHSGENGSCGSAFYFTLPYKPTRIEESISFNNFNNHFEGFPLMVGCEREAEPCASTRHCRWPYRNN